LERLLRRRASPAQPRLNSLTGIVHSINERLGQTVCFGNEERAPRHFVVAPAGRWGDVRARHGGGA